VLFINLELAEHSFAKRLGAIATKLQISDKLNCLHVLNLRGHLVNLQQLQEKLGALIKQWGIGLVIIDPLYKISAASMAAENSNDEQGLLLYGIEAICTENNASVVITHHFAKGNAASKNAIDRGSGGGVLARWPDVVMTFTEHEVPDCMTVEMALRDFAPVAPFVVRWEYPIWRVEPELSPAALKNPGRVDRHPAEDALAAIGAESLTLPQLKERLVWSESTLRRKLTALLAANRITFVDGVYTRC
jgi:hypothetical protein